MADDREERIRKRAYEMWQRDGSPEGQHHAHWQEAEAEVDAEMTAEAGAGGTAQDVPKGEAKPAKPARSRKSTADKTSADKPAGKTATKSTARAAKAAPKTATARKPRAKKETKPPSDG